MADSRGLSLVLLLCALGLTACQPSDRTVVMGRADLSAVVFSDRTTVELDGAWSFSWKAADALPPVPTPTASLRQVPGYWNGEAGSPYPAWGQGTYRLHLSLPEDDRAWALGLPEISAAWLLRVNDRVIDQAGTATTDVNLYRPEVRPRVVKLPGGGGDYEVELTVVNLSDRVGGIRDSVTVGWATAVERKFRLDSLDAAFFAGGLLVMALFNLIVYFLQRQRAASLWLSLFTLLIACRTLLTGPRLLSDVFPWLGWEQSVPLEYLCIFGAAVSFIYYMKGLFPLWWPARLFIPFLLYTTLFAALTFLLPLRTFADAVLFFYDIPLVMMALVCLGISAWATRERHEDGALVFFAMLFLLGGTINDLIYQFVSLPQGYVLGRFLFVFLVFNTFLLSRQFAKDYRLTQRQAQELLSFDSMKDAFLARVSHELRTPLHGMSGILDAFRQGDFGTLTERQAYHLGLIDASARRLQTMVNSLLDFSQLRQSQMVTETRPVHLKPLVDFLLPAFYSQLKPEVQLINRVGELLPAALGDEVRLEQVLQNLLQNAVQHTVSGSVTLEAELRDQQVVLQIRDTGPGIRPEHLSQVFSPFSQVAEVDTRFTGGLGLGLAVSRQLMQLMGGSLTLSSIEGSGTTAVLKLPVCPPSKLQYYRSPRLRADTGAPPRRLPDLAPAAVAPPPAEPEPDLPDSSSATILIVDDEAVNLLVLRTFLGRLGFRVLEAGDGLGALAVFRSQTVDLVILDIMMPGMSGYEVTAELRKTHPPEVLPILLLTAKNQVEDLLKGFAAGASDFLTKPFQRDVLKARMEMHLKVARAGQAARGALPSA